VIFFQKNSKKEWLLSKQFMNPNNLQSRTIYNQHPLRHPPKPPRKLQINIFLSFFKGFLWFKVPQCTLRRFYFFLWTPTTKNASPKIHQALNHWMFVHTNLVTLSLNLSNIAHTCKKISLNKRKNKVESVCNYSQ
jgi:hypothetical protein